MKIEVFDTTMTAFKKRIPYHPFTVVLVNGDRYEVDHPEAIVIRKGVALYIGPSGVPVIFDHDGVNEVIGDLKNSTVS